MATIIVIYHTQHVPNGREVEIFANKPLPTTVYIFPYKNNEY